MENTENQSMTSMQDEWNSEQKRGKILFGLGLVLVGGLLLGREFGLEIPAWLFSWKVLLIGIGVFSAIKSGYRSWFWVLPWTVGTVFLMADFYPDIVNKRVIWPIILIGAGFIIMLKPRRKNRWKRFKNRMEAGFQDRSHQEERCNTGEPYSGSTLEFTAFMAGISKNVISKDFRKGEINAVLGGADVNFDQADIIDKAYLEINAVLGGVKLVVPANWEVRSEINCVMGGVDDRRAQKQSDLTGPQKVLILEGNAVMGGIEIKSY